MRADHETDREFQPVIGDPVIYLRASFNRLDTKRCFITSFLSTAMAWASVACNRATSRNIASARLRSAV